MTHAKPRSEALRDPDQVVAFWSLARRTLTGPLTWLWGFEVKRPGPLPEGPLLVVANHISYVDPLLVGYALSRPGAFMAKQELFRIPGLNAFIRSAGAFPVQRGKGDQGALDTALAVLDQGWPLLIYPEGTRNPEARWGSRRLRTGAARLALARPVPIVPVGLVGTQHILPKGALVPKRVHAEARIGEPIYPADYLPPDDLPAEARIERVTERIYEAIAGLLPPYMVAPRSQ